MHCGAYWLCKQNHLLIYNCTLSVCVSAMHTSQPLVGQVHINRTPDSDTAAACYILEKHCLHTYTLLRYLHCSAYCKHRHARAANFRKRKCSQSNRIAPSSSVSKDANVVHKNIEYVGPCIFTSHQPWITPLVKRFCIISVLRQTKYLKSLKTLYSEKPGSLQRATTFKIIT